MKRLLLLIPTTTYRARDFLQAAYNLQKEEEIEVVVASEKQMGLESLLGGSLLTVDFKDPQKGAHEILKFHQERPLDALVPVDEQTLLVAARACEKLALPFNSPESITISKSKDLIREKLTQKGLLQPAFHRIPLWDNSENWVSKVPFPSVLKPLHLAASQGVIRVNNREEFLRAFERVKKIILREECPGPEEGYLLAEEYIPGEEVALEGLVDRGKLRVLALFDKPDPLEGPYFEETIYTTPSRHSQNLQEEIQRAVSLALEAFGLTTGPIHAEIRINEKGPWVLEVAARSIGGFCGRMLRFGTGMSLEEIILRQALSLPLPDQNREKAAAGVMMIPIPQDDPHCHFEENQPSVLGAYRGREEALSIEEIESVDISIPLWGEVVPLPEGNRYLGFIFARGENPLLVEEALRKAHSHLKFIILPQHFPGKVQTFFPPKILWTAAEEHYINLVSLGEEPLFKNRTLRGEIYRLLYTPSLKAARAVILRRIEKDQFLLEYKELGKEDLKVSSKAELQVRIHRRRTLQDHEGNLFLQKLEDCFFWKRTSEGTQMGIEGDNWTLEGLKGGQYQMVDRWSLEKEDPFYGCCKYLIDLARP